MSIDYKNLVNKMLLYQMLNKLLKKGFFHAAIQIFALSSNVTFVIGGQVNLINNQTAACFEQLHQLSCLSPLLI